MLTKLIAALASYDGSVDLRGAGVHAIRLSQSNDEPIHCVQPSSLCIVAQGAKIVMIGEDTYAYEAGQMALYSIDVPRTLAYGDTKRIGALGICAGSGSTVKASTLDRRIRSVATVTPTASSPRAGCDRSSSPRQNVVIRQDVHPSPSRPESCEKGVERISTLNCA